MPVRNAAPRTLLAGPLPIVSTGYRSAWSRLISVPSFCAKNVTGRRPCAASASRMARATSRATPARAPLRMVAFSRSSRPDRADLVAERQVHLAELALDHLGRLELVARRDRGEHAGDRDAVGLVADLAEEPGDGVGVERGQVLPVELDPAVHDRGPDRDGPDEVARPAEHGPDAVGGGPADPDTATRRRFTRSRTALVAWVVPSMTWLIRPGLAAGGGEHGVDGGHDPAGDVGGAGHLGLGDHPVGGVHDHRVGVGAADVDAETAVRRGTGQLLHGQVVEVVAERARPGELDARLGPPDRVAGEGDHGDPLAVGDPLGPDRVGRLGVQHGDQVGHRGEHAAALQCYQVLVLQLQPDQPAGVRAQALDDHRAADEAASWSGARRRGPCRRSAGRRRARR